MAKRRRRSSSKASSDLIATLLTAIVALIGLAIKVTIELIKLLWKGLVALITLLVNAAQGLWNTKLTIPIKDGIRTNVAVLIMAFTNTEKRNARQLLPTILHLCYYYLKA